MVLQYVNGVYSTGNTYIDELILEHGVREDNPEEVGIHLGDRAIILFYNYCVVCDLVRFHYTKIDYEWDEEETKFCINISEKDRSYETLYGTIKLDHGNIKTVSIIYNKEKLKIDFLCKHNIRYYDFYNKSKLVLEDIMSNKPKITDIPDLYNQAMGSVSCTKNARK